MIKKNYKYDASTRTWNVTKVTQTVSALPADYFPRANKFSLGEIIAAPFAILVGLALIAAILIIPIAWLLFPLFLIF